jgi:hypothetical protein
MKRWCVVAVAALCITSIATADTGIGKYAGEFLAIGVGARPLGLGGAYVALAGDVSAGYWNPAGLARIDYPELMLMHAEHFGSLVNHDYGAVAFPMGTSTSLGISLIRLGVDDIPDTRNAGVDAGGSVTYDPNQFSRIDPSRVTYFSSADWALYFTLARRHSDNLTYGANLKLIRRELGDNNATGVGFDLGIQYSPVERLLLGANLQDVTTTLVAWNTGRNDLISPTLKTGAAYVIDALGGRFTPVVDFDLMFENRRSAATFSMGPVSFDVQGGLEYAFKDLIAVRVGYSDVKQLTLGAGLSLPKLIVDYSFAKFDATEQLGNTHRISVKFILESDRFRRTDG